MYTLNAIENSDARCGSDIQNFPSFEAARAAMESAYNHSLKIFGGTFEKEENELKYLEEQRWANISDTSAHIQIGLDEYRWEITEDPAYVPAQAQPAFAVVGCTTSSHNGDLIMIEPKFASSEEEAKRLLKQMYLDELEDRCLEDNNACDENDESCPGGCYEGEVANIWDYADYAFHCLVNVAHFRYFPIKNS